MFQAKGQTNVNSSMFVEPHEDGGVLVKVVEGVGGTGRRSDIVLSQEHARDLSIALQLYFLPGSGEGTITEPTPLSPAPEEEATPEESPAEEETPSGETPLE